MVSDGMNARVGSLTASPEWFMPWRTIADEKDRPVLEFELEKIVRGFFRPDLFLDYIRYFVPLRAGWRYAHQENRRLSPVPRRA